MKISRLTILGLTFGGLLTSASIVSAAPSCAQRAQNCVNLGGNPGACKAPDRLAACERSGMYTAPSGNIWKASVTKKK